MSQTRLVLPPEEKFLDTVIGRYRDTRLKKQFIAKRLSHPNFRKMPKFQHDLELVQTRLVFHTNRGSFYGPVIEKCSPPENVRSTYREFLTFPVQFIKDFEIQAVHALDMTNGCIVKAVDVEYPIHVLEEYLLQFSFRFDQCIR